jgi:hypothetical protein
VPSNAHHLDIAGDDADRVCGHETWIHGSARGHGEDRFSAPAARGAEESRRPPIDVQLSPGDLTGGVRVKASVLTEVAMSRPDVDVEAKNMSEIPTPSHLPAR